LSGSVTQLPRKEAPYQVTHSFTEATKLIFLPKADLTDMLRDIDFFRRSFIRRLLIFQVKVSHRVTP